MSRTSNIILLATLFSLLSCTEKEVTTILPNEGPKIEFDNLLTKAVNTKEDIDEFGVSIALSNEASGADYVSLLDNEQVYQVENSNPIQWKYKNTRYWIENSHFYFVASYPYGQNENEPGYLQELEEEHEGIKRIGYSLNVNTYNIEAKTHNGVDILTASKYVSTTGEWEKTVNLNFRHMLTKINVKISQNLSLESGDPNNDYYITKVSISGINTSGQYYMIPGNGQIDCYWALDNANNYSFEKTFSGDQTLKSQGVISVWGYEGDENGNGGLLLIPQEIPLNSVKIRVEYLYQYSQQENQDDPTGGNQQEKKPGYIETYLPASPDLWQSNKRITYRLSIAKPTKINFLAPTIESWGTPQTGGTIIIK